MELLTATAYAKHRARLNLTGTSQVAVTKAIQAGRLTKPAVKKNAKGHWQIDPKLADIQWEERTRPGNHYFRQPIDIQDPEDPPEPADPEQPADPGLPAVRGSVSKSALSVKTTKAEADRRTALYKSERMKIALLKEMGEVGNIKDMQREASRLATVVRQNVMMLADRLPAKLSVVNSEPEIREILLEEITLALRSIS